MSQEPVHSTADGPSSARALKLVVVELRAELVVSLRPRIAARIVWAKRPTRVIHNLAQVQLVGLNELELVVVSL